MKSLANTRKISGVQGIANYIMHFFQEKLKPKGKETGDNEK